MTISRELRHATAALSERSASKLTSSIRDLADNVERAGGSAIAAVLVTLAKAIDDGDDRVARASYAKLPKSIVTMLPRSLSVYEGVSFELEQAMLSEASSYDIEDALDELAAPIRAWVHRPDSEGKSGIADAYAGLSAKAKAALDADVRRVVGGPFTAYRRPKGGSEVLRGLDSVTTEKPAKLSPDQYRTYRIDPSDVLVHWKQDTPLGKGSFAHEREVILKPGVSIKPTAEE